nr:MAG TPA: DNA mismatch endonuclease [Caudoviricetes sp.]
MNRYMSPYRLDYIIIFTDAFRFHSLECTLLH